MQTMAKDHSRYQQGIIKRYYEHQETIRSERLSDLVAEIWLCEEPAQAAKLWGRAQVALMKAGCSASEAAKVAGSGDVETLAKLVKSIDAGAIKPSQDAGRTGDARADEKLKVARGARSVADGRTIEQMKRDKAASEGKDSLQEPNLKRALGAFRRKLKLARRDDESQIRGRYTTRGEASKIVAISPPADYPQAVWQELVRLGRLKPGGGGTYQLP